MKKVIRWILVIGLLGALAGGAWWFWRRQQPATGDELEVLRTAESVRDTLNISVPASGAVTMERRVDLSFTRPGTVQTVSVAVGDRVAAGEELARLDDDALVDAVHQSELDLAQAKLNLETALKPPDEDDISLAQLAIREATQAMQVAKLSEQYAEVRATIDQTRAREIEADLRDAYETYIDILDDYALPRAYAAPVTAQYMEAEGNVGITQLRSDYSLQQAQSQWQSAYQRYQQAQLDLERLQEGPDQDQIRRLELQIEQAEIARDQSQADLDLVQLVAPFAGIVADVNLQANTAAPVARPAVTLLDDSSIYVDLSIDEIDIGAIDPGQLATLALDAYPGINVTGIVERIDPVPETSGGIIAYPVRVRITDTNGTQVREGMTASAQVHVGEKKDVVLIPNWAVRTDSSTETIFTYCYCGEDNVPQRVAIEIGLRNETWTEVVSGLDAGARIALVAESQTPSFFQGPPSRGLE